MGGRGDAEASERSVPFYRRAGFTQSALYWLELTE